MITLDSLKDISRLNSAEAYEVVDSYEEGMELAKDYFKSLYGDGVDVEVYKPKMFGDVVVYETYVYADGVDYFYFSYKVGN